jgi:hypothetical protein
VHQWQEGDHGKEELLVFGDKVLMQPWLGNHGLFLFVFLIPQLKL